MIFVEYLCVIDRTLGFWCFLFYSWVPNQWAMNHRIYTQRLVHYRIFVWSSQLILWPLLCPLHFVINEHNKCVTSSLGKWRSSCSDNHKFLTHQLRPCSNCRLLDEIEQIRLTLHISCIAHLCRFWCLSNWMPRVLPGCIHHADMSRFSRACFGRLFCIFPSSFLSSIFFPYSVSILGFVSSSSFLSLYCIS